MFQDYEDLVEFIITLVYLLRNGLAGMWSRSRDGLETY